MDPLSAPGNVPHGRRRPGARGVAQCIAIAIAVALAALSASAAPAPSDPETARRAAMVQTIREMGGAPISEPVLAAMLRVQRHQFVPPSQRAHAYDNRPLPIGHGQTISQPYIVALMTELAGAKPSHRVLEVGTGSGYQAAVLSKLAGEVYTIEVIEPLATQAAQRLRGPGWRNVRMRTGDGYYGWKAAAPFDAIVVTAAAGSIPPPLLAQLAPGGRMVIPVGSTFFTQTLLLVTKDARGRVRTKAILPVRFVPLTGGH